MPPGASSPRRAMPHHTSKPLPVPVYSAREPPSTRPLRHLPTSGLSLYTPSSRKPSLTLDPTSPGFSMSPGTSDLPSHCRAHPGDWLRQTVSSRQGRDGVWLIGLYGSLRPQHLAPSRSSVNMRCMNKHSKCKHFRWEHGLSYHGVIVFQETPVLSPGKENTMTV